MGLRLTVDTDAEMAEKYKELARKKRKAAAKKFKVELHDAQLQLKELKEEIERVHQELERRENRIWAKLEECGDELHGSPELDHALDEKVLGVLEHPARFLVGFASLAQFGAQHLHHERPVRPARHLGRVELARQLVVHLLVLWARG